MADPIMRALIYRGGNRLKSAWFMFDASRAHATGYGLTFSEWFPGSCQLFWKYLRYRDGRRALASPRVKP